MSGSLAGPDLDALLHEGADRARPRASDGEVADDIAPLAGTDPDRFAIAALALDGTGQVLGEVDDAPPIQSSPTRSTRSSRTTSIHARWP
jgi:glutaminase